MLVVAVPSLAAQDEIYTWTDEHGVVNFTNSGPPQGAKATPVSTSGGDFHPVPLEVANDNPARKLVRVELQGTDQQTEVRMIVDTGSEKTLIDRSVATGIGVRFIRDQVVRGVTGSGEGALVELPGLRIGSAELRDVDVVVGPAGAPNLLGMDVLNRLNLSVGQDSLYRDRH
jgi:clan AA aspartic protease (TIGR02281 family)